MHAYTPKTFNIPKLERISEKQITEHLKLYEGYVKHVNTIFTEMRTLMPDSNYTAHELWRRLGFEWNGMRNHEYYFGALEEGPKPLGEDTALSEKLASEHGGLEGFLSGIKETSTTRGSGWVLAYVDTTTNQILIGWVDEHHLGGLLSLPVILAVDCWEHAYMVDYLPGERSTYVDAYLNNINWDTVNMWFEESSRHVG